jgi:hypothetical protein
LVFGFLSFPVDVVGLDSVLFLLLFSALLLPSYLFYYCGLSETNSSSDSLSDKTANILLQAIFYFGL